MPNNPIDPKLHDALMQAFGGSPAAPAPQPSAPTPTPAGGPGVGSSLYGALFNRQPASEPVDPYMNFANKATGKPSK